MQVNFLFSPDFLIQLVKHTHTHNQIAVLFYHMGCKRKMYSGKAQDLGSNLVLQLSNRVTQSTLFKILVFLSVRYGQ